MTTVELYAEFAELARASERTISAGPSARVVRRHLERERHSLAVARPLPGPGGTR